MTLAEVPIGKTVTVQSIHFEKEFCTRCFALGLRKGAQISVLRTAPLNGPIHIKIGTTELALRKNLAKLIKVL